MDFSGVLAGLSVTDGVLGIIAAGAIMAAPGFARWLTDKVSTFFDGSEDEDDEDEEMSDFERNHQCRKCGDGYVEDIEYPHCDNCGFGNFEDGSSMWDDED